MNTTLSWAYRRLDKLDSSTELNKGTRRASSRKRGGHGLFTWPNGARYEGEFVGNRRHGKGKQEWPDGSSYFGEFRYDVREGYGRHVWLNDETYCGEFVNDKRHGKGTYHWPDGTCFKGHFYDDLKEGYGCFCFPDSRHFEGVYKCDERNGPGIFTYTDGRQDVGLWLGEKLIRLCNVMDNAFLFQHFSDYVVNPGQNIPLKIKRANSAISEVRNVINDEANKQITTESSSLLLQIFPRSFPFADIRDGMRSCFKSEKGPCELASEELLRLSAEGDYVQVMQLLERGVVHVDVADKTGFTALLAASVNCHKDVINCLLDYGADVNKLNCEGLSALAACHVLFYTKHTWKENIAETLTEENILNSVRWDAQTGTFIQRKPVYDREVYVMKKSNTSVSVDECIDNAYHVASECNNSVQSNCCGDEKRDKKTDELMVSTEETRNSEDVNGMANVCYVNVNGVGVSLQNAKTSCPSNECDRNDEYMMIARKDLRLEKVGCRAPNCDVEVFNKPDDGRGMDFEKLEIVTDTFPLDVKPSEEDIVKDSQGDDVMECDQSNDLEISYEDLRIQASSKLTHNHNESIDKISFIHDFLTRTESARSNQNDIDQTICHIRKSSFSEKESSNGLLGNRKSSALLYEQGSLQYSGQNVISKSLPTSSGSETPSDSLVVTRSSRERLLARQRRPHLEATVQLLLKRGANPNASSLPMPVLFFAIKAADVPVVRLLLEKGADPNARLSKEKLGITPLHIAVALPSRAAVCISKLLLEYGADPNLRDFAFGNVENGRTSLHTACCREDNDKDANDVIKLLLQNNADPNLLCNGHCALSLAIGSGNDLAVESLLKENANPSLRLTHGVGSPLCAAVSFTAEKRRKIADHVRLVNKLLRSGANILAPVTISDEYPPGTVVDYAYKVFYQDLRISHTPYHSLTSREKEVYMARRKMLDHLADLLRTQVLKREKKLLEEQLSRAKSLQDDSCGDINEDLDISVNFFIDQSGLGKYDLESSYEKASTTYDESDETLSCFSLNDKRLPDCGLRVAVVHTSSDHLGIPSQISLNPERNKRQLIRKNRFRYCYECGRSVAVRLAACTRCKQVFYCSRNCKLKAWSSRHKAECVRLSARNKSALCKLTESSLSAISNTNKDASLKSHSKESILERQDLQNRSKNVKLFTTKTIPNCRKKGTKGCVK